MDYHLAQVNIARMRGELDEPVMTGFVRRLDEINALADASPGFVWRYISQEDASTYIQPFEDARMLMNMSAWASVEDLKNYVYQSAHVELLKARGRWFTRPDGPHLALWWIPAGTRPNARDAIERLRRLNENGPTPESFTLARHFPPPGG